MWHLPTSLKTITARAFPDECLSAQAPGTPAELPGAEPARIFARCAPPAPSLKTTEFFRESEWRMPTFDANAETLRAELRSDRPVLIQFWAEWCAPCRAMIPIVDTFAAEHEGAVSVARVDIDANPDLSIQYRVTAVPTFVVAQHDDVLASFSGAMPLKPFTAQVLEAISA